MRLFLAGADASEWTRVIYSTKHPYYLSSFWQHIGGFDARWLDWANRTQRQGGKWIMDSGLFSMMFGASTGRTYTETNLMEYMDYYLSQMEEIKWKETIVEMDVHKVLGMPATFRFRKYIENRWDIEKVMFVWHVEEKKEGLVKLAKRYPYIAISVPELKILFKDKHHQMVRQCCDLAIKTNPNIKIHLLGTSSDRLLPKINGYYSADATSWQAGVRYGSFQLFINGRLKKVELDSPLWVSEEKKLREAVWKIVNPFNNKPQYYLRAATQAKQYQNLNVHLNRKFYNGEPVPRLWNDLNTVKV